MINTLIIIIFTKMNARIFMQQKSMASDVYDSFYELFLYEAIETLIASHQAKQTSLKEICADLDGVGR